MKIESSGRQGDVRGKVTKVSSRVKIQGRLPKHPLTPSRPERCTL